MEGIELIGYVTDRCKYFQDKPKRLAEEVKRSNEKKALEEKKWEKTTDKGNPTLLLPSQPTNGRNFKANTY